MHKPLKILISFHTPSNAGYAMSPLEKIFFDVCVQLTGSADRVFYAFKNFDKGNPQSLPDNFKQLVKLDYNDTLSFAAASQYIKENQINATLCFDVQPNAPVCAMLRKSGIKKIISYWGSTISSKNTWYKLILKKFEVLLCGNKPDHYIFESKAMRELALFGRGIAKCQTSIIPTGVNIEKYAPRTEAKGYVRSTFNLPDNAEIIFYSGHMEARKGVAIIVESARIISEQHFNKNIYFIICGNRPGEEIPFLKSIEKTAAESRVIFGGYRNDLHSIMPGCTIGVVASTGWDSFPMSTLEMSSSGLPLIVSRLQGLTETLDDGVTGFTFQPGNSAQLAERIIELVPDKNRLQQFSAAARARIESGYSIQHQFNNLLDCLNKIFNS